MSFALSKTVDPNKVFLTRKSEVTRRWDAPYFIPSIVALEKQVQKTTKLCLRDFVLRMAGGATPATTESETHYTESAEGVPFIRVQNLSTTGNLNLEDCKRITRSTHEKLLERSQLGGGELLVKITGVGRMAVASVVPDGFEGNINQHIAALWTENAKTSEMLAAYLNLDFVERLASRRATGGTRPALDYPALLSLPVIFDERIPKLVNAAIKRSDEQFSKASSLLASVDDLLLTELGFAPKPAPPNAVKNRIFLRAFSAVTGNRLDPLYHHGDMFHFVRAAKCKLAPLGNCVTTFLTGFAAGRNDQADEEGGIIQIRPTNLSDDRELVFRRNVYIARAELKQRPLDVLQRREVLFNNTNSQEQVGKTTFFDLDGEFFCSNHITRIATDASQLDPQFLGYVLNLYQRQQVFFKLATNWNNQSGVGVDVLEKIPVPLPDPKQQEQIVARLEKVRLAAHALRRQAAAELAAAKKSIEAMILGQASQP